MRRGRYLNVILTVNAVLLAGVLWVSVADEPMLATPATAQSRTRPTEVVVPNAATQRHEMIEQLRKLSQSVEALKKQLDGGLKVEVTNLDQIDR